MTISPNYYSDEEILKRLHAILVERPVRRRAGQQAMSDARVLVGELASRIYDEPGKWGLSQIPEGFRDDVAQDALVDLLAALGTVKDRRSAAVWFSGAVEERFRQIWSAKQRSAALAASANGATPSRLRRTAVDAKNLFRLKDGPWQRFEREFPRDASALRLRYEQGHSTSEMEVMLDAPSESVVLTRIERARARFRMFVEQAGYGRPETAAIMERFKDEAAKGAAQ